MPISTHTHFEVVLATCLVSKGRAVVSCRNPGDAASPVVLHLGDYSKTIGQVADWRHRVEEAAQENDAEMVTTFWDGGWVTTTTADEGAVREVLRQQDEETARLRGQEARREERVKAAARRYERLRTAPGRMALKAVGRHLGLGNVSGSWGVLKDGEAHGLPPLPGDTYREVVDVRLQGGGPVYRVGFPCGLFSAPVVVRLD